VPSIFNITTADGDDQQVTFCSNTYQYSSLDPTEFPFDLVLGDAFLRNVYASFNYGDTSTPPFVQLLSTTDPDAAWAEFLTARAKTLKSLPPTMDPSQLIDIVGGGSDGAAQGALSGAVADDSTDDSSLTSLVKHYGPLVIGLLAGNLLIGLLLLIVGVTVCVRGVVRGGAKSRSVGATYAPVRFKDTVDGEDVKGGFRDL